MTHPVDPALVLIALLTAWVLGWSVAGLCYDSGRPAWQATVAGVGTSLVTALAIVWAWS